jgi:hypothetical protein
VPLKRDYIRFGHEHRPGCEAFKFSSLLTDFTEIYKVTYLLQPTRKQFLLGDSDIYDGPS